MTPLSTLPHHKLAYRLGLCSLLLGLAFVQVPLAQATQVSDNDVEAPKLLNPLPPVRHYTTRPGDSLERIVQQQFRDSPLQTKALIQALQAHNALLIGEVHARQRLRSGLVLELPSHEQLVRQVLQPYLQAEPTHRGHGNEGDQRKAWVRFP